MRGYKKQMQVRNEVDLDATADGVRALLKKVVLHERDKPAVIQLLGGINWAEREALGVTYMSKFGLSIVSDLDKHFH